MKRLVAAVLVLVWVASAFTDAPAADWIHRTGIDTDLHRLRWDRYVEFVKFFGTAGYAAIAAVVCLFLSRPALQWRLRRLHFRRAIGVILAAGLSGLNFVPKWVVGQIRPFKPVGVTAARPWSLHPFWHGWWGLWHETDLAFPSGHASISGAVAAALWFARPSLGWAGVSIAVVVGCERVLENAHYIDDVIAGWVFGWACAAAARALLGPARPEDSVFDPGHL